ncbi:MAG: hypothetical protein HY420_02895 [Candidatus Kerfeldbacteria bacterium]|nr:hypothetical protein [Candidatus Kerfeldbacteria bacterium]
MSQFDSPPPEPDELTSIETEYSSTAPETLNGLAGYDDPKPEKRAQAQAAYEAIPGSTPEEKITAIEQMPKADIRLKREVGRYVADIARGWDEATGKVYESLKIEGLTKAAEIPEIGSVTMKNIRLGQERIGQEVSQIWGDAEFDELPEIPQSSDYETLLTETRSEVQADPSVNEVDRVFEFKGREVHLQVARGPRADWGGKDYHLWGKWPFDDMPEIFKAKLPTPSLVKTAPAERSLIDSKYAFKLQRVEVNLDDDFTPGAGNPRGRLKFKVEVAQPETDRAAAE